MQDSELVRIAQNVDGKHYNPVMVAALQKAIMRKYLRAQRIRLAERGYRIAA